jgi:hypothetical protein
MTNSFSICPKGEQVFRIYKVEYNEEFGKLTVHLVNAQGNIVQNRFSLMNQDGSTNDKACNAFSFFAKNALNDFSIPAVDPMMLVDRYIKLEVTHTEAPSTKEPGKTVTFVNVKSPSVADGFDTEPCSKALTLGKAVTITTAPATEAPATGLDLNALLNG